MYVRGSFCARDVKMMKTVGWIYILGQDKDVVDLEFGTYSNQDGYFARAESIQDKIELQPLGPPIIFLKELFCNLTGRVQQYPLYITVHLVFKLRNVNIYNIVIVG